MTRQETEAVFEETFSDDDIAEYLRRHPDFFDRHAGLLMDLKVAHEPGGAAISLVERQVTVLRQRSKELELQLKDLVAVARLNDALVGKIHELSMQLMTAKGFAARVEMLETCLREEFRAERAVVVLFSIPDDGTPAGKGFLKIVERSDAALKPFSSFLKSARPRCGLIRGRQKAFLFADNTGEISSAALVPLGERAELGFLVIGSRDPDYFNPGKGMDFLTRLGELVSVALVGQQSPGTEARPRENEL
ncbi:MAG: DUF484 family protein [Gammaproteobacteria bacterium]